MKIKTKKKPSQTPCIETPSLSAHPKYFHHKTVKHCMGLLFPSYVKDGLCGAISKPFPTRALRSYSTYSHVYDFSKTEKT